ncbi:MAG: DEAD/DEAH box helicase, partial [Gammaproteobacteria bacterium]
MSLDYFHPVVNDWFHKTFASATEVQRQSWPAIKRHQATLIAAPTGSGKTLAAFMSAIDDLVRDGMGTPLPDETFVLYVSPLKALSNDIQKNLQQPLNGIRDMLLESGMPDICIRALVRTGDTPQAERNQMRRKPPHILVTTPESLYILLTSESGRKILSTVRTVIVDEIHALAANKRGAHLSLSLQRLDALCTSKPTRIGLSATQRPITSIAEFLTGESADQCQIIDTGHTRERDLALELTSSPLQAVMPNEVWEEIYDRLTQLIDEHKTTLIFVNTRRLAERAAHNLADRIGDTFVTAHHGSLSREHRLHAEQQLKAGKLKALVATASLELGIDIGDADLVCQLGTPGGIATFLQRVGRSGHAVDKTPKGRLFPLTCDDLVECAALLDSISRNELDELSLCEQPMDVLAQQIVAEVASREWEEQALYQQLKQAHPYRELSLASFQEVIKMLADGFTTRRGRRGAYIHHDRVNNRLRARRGARLVSVTNGGAIPDHFDYDVVLQPEGHFIGTLNEDFAFESLPGDIFQLGNTSYRMLKIEQGRVFVEDAKGEPPNIPFWFGEAPGRTDELSQSVSRLRQQLDQYLEQGSEQTIQWLTSQHQLSTSAAQQLVEYLAAAKAALGVLPNQTTIIFERFFDETGDLHLVVHSAYGSRINRAWGLSLRKRFCRKFNFELQAAAMEDSIVLSLGATHSFPLEEVAGYLKPESVRDILIQALLDAPMFPTHWRWNANISLAVPRNRNGKKVPAYFQRNDAEDLVSVIFPDQLACFENIAGKREVPDHPLVNQTIHDCLTDLMDIEGLEKLLNRIIQGEVTIVCKDLNGPSPLSQAILNARPYAFLDDAPAEERRTLAVQQRRFADPQSASELAHLDPAAIKRVRKEAWPDPRDADELHDALVLLGFVTETEMTSFIQHNNTVHSYLDMLTTEQRIAHCTLMDTHKIWVAAERLHEVQIVFPDYTATSTITAIIDNKNQDYSKQQAILELVRSRLEGLGPATANQLATDVAMNAADINQALLTLEQEGFAIRGQFTSNEHHLEWCDRRLLARIHRYTIKSLRSEIKPVSISDFMQFLFHWHHLYDKVESKDALLDIVKQLEGFSIQASAWETDIFPSRMSFYLPDWMDGLCNSGRINWMRITSSNANSKCKSTPIRITPIALMLRQHTSAWLNKADDEPPSLPVNAQTLLNLLKHNGALFFDDLVSESNLLRSQVETALGQLVARGLVTSDSFVGLRALITPSNRRPGFGSRRRLNSNALNIEDAGRWTLIKTTNEEENASQSIEHIAKILLKRYGVVFRKLLERENNLPSWRELLYVYRRMEARGEVRGGRFVAGFSGEQFAVPDAVSLLRKASQHSQQDLVVISAVDPLNLTGFILPGPRVTNSNKNKILFRNGKPIAISKNGQVEVLEELDQSLQWQAQTTLLKKHSP